MVKNVPVIPLIALGLFLGAVGAVVRSSDDLWKILAHIRAHYAGDPAHKFGTPAAQQ